MVPGSPVINEAGVLGQVTRVYPLTREVTLLTDKDAAIPVLNTRTQQRSAAFGGAGGGTAAWSCASWPATPTCRSATCCTTSGVDGVYPPGLPVARWPRWSAAPNRASRASCSRPRRQPDGVRHVLVLEPLALQLPPRPEAAAADAPARAERQLKAPPRRAPGSAMTAPRPGAAPMIMPRGSDQLLLPVNPLLHRASRCCWRWRFNMLPLGRQPALPDLLALVLVFWNVHQPRRVGVGVAFVFGLLMDVHQGALLGQHALAYTLLSFVAITIHRRLLWFGLPSSRRCRSCRCSSPRTRCRWWCGMLAGGMFPGWWLLLAPVFEALLWPLVTLLLLAPQRRAPDPDQNRPL